MPQDHGSLGMKTSVLFIDGFDTDRAYWATQLRSFSPDYEILEAANGQSGLTICRSRRVDCIVLELALPDKPGLELLMTLVPHVNKPNIAVIVLTQLMTEWGLRELVRGMGAHECLRKKHTTGGVLDKAIQQAVGSVGQIPKEDRIREQVAK